MQRRLNAFYGVDKNFNIPTDVINAEQKEIKEQKENKENKQENEEIINDEKNTKKKIKKR